MFIRTLECLLGALSVYLVVLKICILASSLVNDADNLQLVEKNSTTRT